MATATTKECPFCSRLFDTPKILPCLHSACEACLLQQISEDDQVSCPLCKLKFNIPNGDICQLPSNIHLEERVKQTRLIRQLNHSVVLACGTCGNGSIAKMWCSDCDEFLCDDCHSRHSSLPGFGDHILTHLEEIRSGSVKPQSLRSRRCTCRAPCTDEATRYCYTCEESTCENCISHRHQYHDCVDLTEALNVLRANVKNIVAQLKERVRLLEESKPGAIKYMETIRILACFFPRTLLTKRIEEIIKYEKNIDARLKKSKRAIAFSTDFFDDASDSDFLSDYSSKFPLVKDILEEYYDQDALKELKSKVREDIRRFNKKHLGRIGLFILGIVVLYAACVTIFIPAALNWSDICDMVRHQSKYVTYMFTSYMFTTHLSSHHHQWNTTADIFHLARGVTVGLNDRTFIADAGSESIVILDNQGKVVNNFSLPNMVTPQDLATTSNGEIVLVDGSRFLRFFDINGVLLNTTDVLQNGSKIDVNYRCIATDFDDNIIIGDHKRKVVTIHARNGTIMHRFNVEINGVQRKPSFLAVSRKQQIAIGNFQKTGLFIFDYSGKHILTVNTSVHGRSGRPAGVYFDKNNDMLVALHFKVSQEVHRFSITGMHLGCIMKGLEHPFGISISNDDKMLIVADKTSVKQQMKSNDDWDLCPSTSVSFHQLKSWRGHFQFAHGVAVNDNGDIAVVDMDRARVTLHSKDGNYILTFGNRYKNPQSRLYKPTSIHRSLNNFVVVDESNFIRFYKPTGSFIGRFAIPFKKKKSENILHDVHSVAVDNDRNLIIGDFERKMVTIQSKYGDIIKTITTSVSPVFVSVTSNMQILVTGYNEGIIEIFNYDGEVSSYFKTITHDKISLKPTSVISDRMGGFYVTAYNGILGQGSLHQFSVAGTYVKSISEGLMNPRGLCLNHNQLFVADMDSVKVFSIEYL